MRHRKISMIRKYSHRLRMRHFAQICATQEEKYGEYFLNGRQQPITQQLAQQAQNVAQELEEIVEDEVEADLAEEELDEDGEGDFSVADYIQLLSPQERKAFKQDNPQLPPLFFMTKAEKKKYFQNLNKTFHNQMVKLPQRKSKTKKILKFSNEFQVKHFNEKQNVLALAKAKGLKQKYQQQVHFS